MRTLATLMLLAVGSVAAFAAPQSDVPEPRRIPVRSADPYFIKAMLEGQMVSAPEMSTIWGVLGMPQSTTAAITQLFQGGHLVVNPTDNSLWFFPDRPKK